MSLNEEIALWMLGIFTAIAVSAWINHLLHLKAYRHRNEIHKDIKADAEGVRMRLERHDSDTQYGLTKESNDRATLKMHIIQLINLLRGRE